MKVAICTTNESIMLNLVSMVAKNGCKFTKVKKYSLENVKSHDICIFDFDNLKDYLDTIKKDAQQMGEMLLIGISRSDDILDMFRPLMNVEKKPFLLNTFSEYKASIKELAQSEYVINKDTERIYDSLGIKISDLLDEEMLSNEEKLSLLKEKISKSKTKIVPESEFIENIGISNIPIPEPKVVESVIKINNIFEDNALLMYRTSKLKKLNLSPIEIEEKLRILTEKQAAQNSKPNNSSSEDLLNRLKSGYFSTKKNVIPNTSKPQLPSLDEVMKKQNQHTQKEQNTLDVTPKESVHIEENKTEENRLKEELKDKPKEKSIFDTEFSEIDKKYMMDDSIIEDSLPEVKEELTTLPKPKIESKHESKIDSDYVDSSIYEIKEDEIIEDDVAEKPIVEKPIIEEIVKNKETINETPYSSIPTEKEAMIKEKLAKLKSLRRENIDVEKPEIPPIKEPPTEKNILEDDFVLEQPKTTKKEEELFELDTALTRMGGNRPQKENKQPQTSIKHNNDGNLTDKLPKSSLFDLIKDKVAAAPPKEDAAERRKREIDKKTRPPRR